ncbi:uncharacterized protein B0I36DRAFT_389804 [Microdochium trichocladiopsis]|uniref:Heterokaryon incompatibility domain-containing protein n=2 Tax=Microdochium trichocladiopsis TaxID=1682393 RepID=A0A9P8XTG5_9PEZI|nr:uncharacterized protein B0I36DRAFT_389804 [Microdochium trichocladiopsis]KAH7010905.1 hypothetical protein B0I36DRAFT_389804 [Microdochium trichocladiopsis]
MDTDDYVRQRNTSCLADLGHSLVRLSPDNISKLLLTASGLPERRRAEGDAICARLAELNPDVAKHFQSKQTATSRLKLRMIQPRSIQAHPAAVNETTNGVPQLQEDPDRSREVDSFIVVSYCWHYPDWPLPAAASPIAPGWEVSRPMVDEVMRLAQVSVPGDGGGSVWLDKLCINQADEDDKSTHVGAMDMIYRSARRVVILLENVQLGDEEEMEAALAYRKFYQDMCDHVKEHDLEGAEKGAYVKECFPRSEKEWCERHNSAASSGGSNEPAGKFDVAKLRAAAKRFVSRLLQARWFTRACTTSGDTGSRVLSFEFRFIHYFALYLCELVLDRTELAPSLDMLPHHQTRIDDPGPTELWQLWYRIQRLHPERGAACSAMQHLVSIMSFGCTFKGDLMSIALNTSSIPLVFRGSAECVEDVIWMFALLVIAAGDVVPLIANGGKLRFPPSTTLGSAADEPGGPVKDGDTAQLVSWAPRPMQGVLDDTIPLRDKSYITAVTRDYIELDLLVFTALPAMATQASQDKADALIAKFHLDAMAETFAAAANAETQRQSEIMAAVFDRIKDGQPGSLHVFVKVWLAHGIDCGTQWMLRFPEIMRQDTQDWTYGVPREVEDETLLSAARELLSLVSGANATPHSQGDELKAAQEAPRSDLGTAQDDETMIRRMALYLRMILDPRLKFYATAPRRLPLGGDDHAITFSSSNRSYIAVPLALVPLPSWQKRAWVLEPYDPSTDPPESFADFLPNPARTCIEPGEVLDDVYPVLSSDYADRRRPRDDKVGAWRLRRREQIFGFRGWDEAALQGMMARSSKDGDGEGYVVYMKKQRVYGAEDYDWGAILEVAKRIEGTGAAETTEGKAPSTPQEITGEAIQGANQVS